ncbi:FKBP17-1, chloroplastic [Seminavis robusta]|uniref:peptidylprolyl isomerase n=1 Tax=Seminavis robusta TaxID=568900 RepID=A0A9N8E932_9STRA|nr:FKBP17-1, chloroplastic [Seminavis robusta]|eukprot:Sro820_g207310.1 FKBP17-1, chloroplastic (236) ;mRNA; f:41260-41967
MNYPPCLLLRQPLLGLLICSCWLISHTRALSLPSGSNPSIAGSHRIFRGLSSEATADTTRRSCFALLGLFAPSSLPAHAADARNKLTFQTLDSGVRVADIFKTSRGDIDSVVTANSKVNIHVTGRLLGKQGWIFEDSQAAGEDPFRLDLGTGTVIRGLEEGLIGMRPGDRRRIVIPSAVGYTSKQLEPIPRDFGNRQRLYTTVMNSVRIERERAALGQDLAGVVVLDVDLLRLRN